MDIEDEHHTGFIGFLWRSKGIYGQIFGVMSKHVVTFQIFIRK